MREEKPPGELAVTTCHSIRVNSLCTWVWRTLPFLCPTEYATSLILLKLYALPSLYRQGLFDRVSVREGDIASLLQRYRCGVEPLFQRLHPHLQEGDRQELRVIANDILARIARFEQFKKI